MTLLILSLFAQAEESKVVYKEKTEIDFEALDIEGTTKKPNQALIMENTRVIFNPLIKLREEWHKEMLDSLNEIE